MTPSAKITNKLYYYGYYDPEPTDPNNSDDEPCPVGTTSSDSYYGTAK
jgi:hypothetical protein